MTDAKPKDVAGCLVSLLMLCVTLPIWLVLLYGILSLVDAPGWMWALYWVYIPASLAVLLVSVVVKLFEDA